MGFSAQVQEPQTSGGSGKGSSIASAAQQVSNPAPSTTTANIPSVVQDNFTTGNNQPTQSFADTIRPMGKGGVQTNSATSGQPRMGAPNQYPNTVGQWDNTQQQRPMAGGGKGKG